MGRNRWHHYYPVADAWGLRAVEGVADEGLAGGDGGKSVVYGDVDDGDGGETAELRLDDIDKDPLQDYSWHRLRFRNQ